MYEVQGVFQFSNSDWVEPEPPEQTARIHVFFLNNPGNDKHLWDLSARDRYEPKKQTAGTEFVPVNERLIINIV